MNTTSPSPGQPVNDDELQGEGNYTATRRHRESVKQFIEDGKVEQAAHDAAPASADEAQQLKDAEQAGLSHARK